MGGMDDMRLGDLLKVMDKAPQMVDDLHRMTDYIGDLRLITIVLAGTGYVVGVLFLLFKLYQYKVSSGASAAGRHRYHSRDAVDDGYCPSRVLVDRHYGCDTTRPPPPALQHRRSPPPPPVVPYSASGRAYLNSVDDPLDMSLGKQQQAQAQPQLMHAKEHEAANGGGDKAL